MRVAYGLGPSARLTGDESPDADQSRVTVSVVMGSFTPVSAKSPVLVAALAALSLTVGGGK
ncbi:hypothetical protein JCM4914_07030 [Streptomyces platensis subsp. malvinus]